MIEYVPPSRDTLYQMAQQLCAQHKLTEEHLLQGLTDFLVVVARIKAKQLSQKGIQHGTQSKV